MLEIVAGHRKIALLPLDFGVDALDCGAHHTPEDRGSGAALTLKESEDIRPQFDDWHIPNLFCHLKVNVFVLAVNDGGHLRRHEELPQLYRRWSSLFPLGEKIITQRFDDPSVALLEPLGHLPVPELGLFVSCDRLVLFAPVVESVLRDWDLIDRS
jgi:hypothetical protein